MDAVEFFKIIRRQSRCSKTKVSYSPLKKIEKGMKSLRDANIFIATTKKLNLIIDCASSSPKVKGKA